MEEAEIQQRLASTIQGFGEFAKGILLAHLVSEVEQASKFFKFKSQIEETFFLAWHAARSRDGWFGSGHGGAAHSIVHGPYFKGKLGEHQPKGDGIYQIDEMSIQYPIGNYRADFVVCRKLFEPEFDRYLTSPLVVIECDGHDFHERTKEQAGHDKKRDRSIQREGYYVLRFTGSEIYRDPSGCVEQVDEALEEHLTRELKQQRKSRATISA